ncbi:unnamed protein product [Closterium sp. NIES-54]
MGAVGSEKDVTVADVTIPEESLPDPLSPSPVPTIESLASLNAHTHYSHTRSTHPISRGSLFPDSSTNPTSAEASLGSAPTAAPFARPVLQARPISPRHRHRPASAARVGRNPNPDLGARVRVDLTPSLDRLARRTNVVGSAGAAEAGSEQARAARQLLFGGTAEVAGVSGGASGASGAAGAAEIARKGVEEGEKEVWGGDVVGELEPLQQQGVGVGGVQDGAVGRGGGDSDGEGGGSDSEILSRLPQGLVSSVRKREEQQRAEATDEARQARRRRLLLAELPLLTDMVVALFASCRAAVLPHRDLVVRLVANHSKQTNQGMIGFGTIVNITVCTMSLMERSYVMIKPDGVQRGLCPKELAEEHYKDLADKPFYKGLVDYIISGPVVAMVCLTLHSSCATLSCGTSCTGVTAWRMASVRLSFCLNLGPWINELFPMRSLVGRLVVQGGRADQDPVGSRTSHPRSFRPSLPRSLLLVVPVLHEPSAGPIQSHSFVSTRSADSLSAKRNAFSPPARRVVLSPASRPVTPSPARAASSPRCPKRSCFVAAAPPVSSPRRPHFVAAGPRVSSPRRPVFRRRGALVSSPRLPVPPVAAPTS